MSIELIKQLRDATGLSVMQCKKALEEAEGDLEKAKILLRKSSKKAADKKADRQLGSGVVASYIHGEGSVGAMVELLCETDFVAKNEEFKTMARDIAMHITASVPSYVRESDIDATDRQKATEIFKAEVADKPAEMQEKILEGKLNAYFAEKILVKQNFIKNSEQTIEQLVEEGIQKFGEKIEIGRMSRFSISG
jgi:elongation factor Ts